MVVCLYQRLHTSENNSVQAVGVQRASRSKVSQSFATTSDDAVPCDLREVRRSNDYVGYGGQADDISHCANSNNYPGEGEVGAVVFGEERSAEDYLLFSARRLVLLFVQSCAPGPHLLKEGNTGQWVAV